MQTKHIGALVTGVMVGLLGLAAMPPAVAVPNIAHPGIVNEVPGENTPNVQDGTVFAIARVGTKVVIGGDFTSVMDRDSTTSVSRPYILAFDQVTGAVDTGFAPVLDGMVETLSPGPDNTVYVGGGFSKVNGTVTKLARLDLATGQLVKGWKKPGFDGRVQALDFAAGRLFVGGAFTVAGNGNKSTWLPHAGIASLDPLTGTVTSYVSSQLAGHHSWTSTNGWKSAPVGVKALDVSPTGTEMMVMGNFTSIDGVARDQIAKFRFEPANAVLDADWNSLAYTALCAKAFDSYVREIQYSPDGSYFAAVATGGGGSTPQNKDGTRSNCDTTTRFESAASGANVKPSWIARTGNDTFWSVAVTGKAVYVGGHMRWLNNSSAQDAPGQGAVPRPGIAALDPLNGLPLKWNGARHPRGAGAYALLATEEGLYVGSDTDYVGNRKYYRGRVAFFPLDGGSQPTSTEASSLPGTVYRAGGFGNATPNALYRVNVGGPALPAEDGSIGWAADSTDPSPYRMTGTTVTTATLSELDATANPDVPNALFSTQRYDTGTKGDGKEMHWSFPVPAGTGLQVRLYFDESAMSAAGQRSFSVNVDGTTVLSKLDVFAEAGRRVGTMRSFPVTSDGVVDLDFIHEVNNPMVSGIEIIQTSAPSVPPEGLPVYRLNAGGPVVASADAGPAWAPDVTGSTTQGSPWRAGGTAATYTTPITGMDSTVPPGTPSSLFLTEVSSTSTQRYSLPVPAGTEVLLRLYWANQSKQTNQVGKRIFNVAVDGTTRLTNVDVVARAGGDQRATMAELPVTSDGRIDVDFVKGTVNNPFINAIEVIQTSAAPSIAAAPDADGISVATFDGASVTADAPAAWGEDWHRVRGAFVVGDTLFYGWDNGTLRSRSVVGQSFGPPEEVNPYFDPVWSTVATGSTSGVQYYRGVLPAFYISEVESVSSLFYAGGRIYFTLEGKPTMYSRYFSPDSGTVGSEVFTVADGRDWSNTAGAFLSGSALYYADRTDGSLRSISWNGSMAEGSPSVVDTSRNWASRAMFVVSAPSADASITYRGAASALVKSNTPGVTVPATVRSGDTLLLFATVNSTAATVAAPAGWQTAGVQDNGVGGIKTMLFTKRALGTDAGSKVSVTLDSSIKTSLTVAAYQGADPLEVSASFSGDANTATHVAPSSEAAARAWSVGYFADKSSVDPGTQAWTVPSGMTARTMVKADAAPSVSSMLADTGAGMSAGPTETWTATADSVSARGNAWNVILVPAS